MGLLDRLRRPRRVTEESKTVQGADLPGGLALQVANLQGAGQRERQEDSFALQGVGNVAQMARSGLFAIVCDGMGGMEDGKAASEGAVSAFVELFHALREEGDIPRQLEEGAHAVNQGIFQRFGGRSGTTAVAVRILGSSLHWLSVGDSALFLCRNGGVFQINEEHTYLNQLYLKALEGETVDRAEAESNPDAPRLSAFIGADALSLVDVNRRPFRLLAGDSLLLCSDGISGVLSPPELLEAMTLEPEAGCALLETYIKEKNLPGQDNYTAILIACK